MIFSNLPNLFEVRMLLLFAFFVYINFGNLFSKTSAQSRIVIFFYTSFSTHYSQPMSAIFSGCHPSSNLGVTTTSTSTACANRSASPLFCKRLDHNLKNRDSRTIIKKYRMKKGSSQTGVKDKMTSQWCLGIGRRCFHTRGCVTTCET